jgi:hypothetical protein
MVERMMSFVIGAAVCAAVLALVCWCAVAGFKNGDQATDAEVSAVLRHSGQPGESRPSAHATVGVVPGETAVGSSSRCRRRLAATC